MHWEYSQKYHGWYYKDENESLCGTVYQNFAYSDYTIYTNSQIIEIGRERYLGEAKRKVEVLTEVYRRVPRDDDPSFYRHGL